MWTTQHNFSLNYNGSDTKDCGLKTLDHFLGNYGSSLVMRSPEITRRFKNDWKSITVLFLHALIVRFLTPTREKVNPLDLIFTLDKVVLINTSLRGLA